MQPAPSVYPITGPSRGNLRQVRVYISYRRADGVSWPARIRDRLEAEFGRESVVMELPLTPGVDWVDAVNRAIQEIDVLVVVMGPRWLSAVNGRGGRRIDTRDDVVAQEIALAYTYGKTVIPVLVDGAVMPSKRDLPVWLSGLPERNAFEVTPSRAHESISHLTSLVARLSEARLSTQEQTVQDTDTASPSVLPTEEPDSSARDIDVFVSYARSDASESKRLLSAVDSAGLRSWADWMIPGGQASWAGAVADAIDRSRLMLVVCSPSSSTSEMVENEVLYAKERHGRGITLMALRVSAGCDGGE